MLTVYCYITCLFSFPFFFYSHFVLSHCNCPVNCLYISMLSVLHLFMKYDHTKNKIKYKLVNVYNVFNVKINYF